MSPDLHSCNIGFKIPGIDQYTGPIVENYGGSISSRSATKFLGAKLFFSSVSCGVYADYGSYPKYFVDEPIVEITPQIMDFGNAFRLQDGHPPEPSLGWAPELMFHKLSNGQVKDEWGLVSDAWSIACMIYEIVTSYGMLPGGVPRNTITYEAMKLVSSLPERWQPYWNPKPFEEFNDNYLMINPDAEWRSMLSEDYRDELDEKVPALPDLLCSMLRWEPMERPSAADLLKHPWFMA